MIYIQKLQGFAHIQDAGRFGLRESGISQAYAMDTLALSAGNLLLKNEMNAPAIELLQSKITLTFDQDTRFCLTGAQVLAYLDDKPIFSYWRYHAKARQTLTIERFGRGNYAYLCVGGGFLVDKVLGSASTDFKGQFGGYYGRYLRAGDVLKAHKSEDLGLLGIAPTPLDNRVGVFPSSEFSAFEAKSQLDFFKQTWQILPQSSRMGYRLSGEPLQLSTPLEMRSYAVPDGLIQVPPDGQPIVLLADAQTTGGYPRFGCVIRAHLGKMAQCDFAQGVHFQKMTAEEATQAYLNNQQYLAAIRAQA